MEKINSLFNFYRFMKVVSEILLAVSVALAGVLLYMVYKNNSSNTVMLAAVISGAVLFAITTGVFFKKEKKYRKEKEKLALAGKSNDNPNQREEDDSSKPVYLDLDAFLSEVHPDIQGLVITNRNIKNYIPKAGSMFSYIGTEPGLVDEHLEVNQEVDPKKDFVARLPVSHSGLSYKKLNPDQRGLYLKFLKDPYDIKNTEIGYLMMFFFSLERHLVHGDGANAADAIDKFRKTYKNKTFSTLSFNALAYFSKKDNMFINFLKGEYPRLNLDYTIYYHLKTDKIFPSEAMIRFKRMLDFPEDAKEINAVMFKNELDRLLEIEYSVESVQGDSERGYPLGKYALTQSMPRLENLAFPANQSMDKLVNNYIATKHLYDAEPFKSDVAGLLKRAYINTVKEDFNVRMRK